MKFDMVVCPALCYAEGHRSLINISRRNEKDFFIFYGCQFDPVLGCVGYCPKTLKQRER